MPKVFLQIQNKLVILIDVQDYLKKEQITLWYHDIKFGINNLQQENNLSLFLLSTVSVTLELKRKLWDT